MSQSQNKEIGFGNNEGRQKSKLLSNDNEVF